MTKFTFLVMAMVFCSYTPEHPLKEIEAVLPAADNHTPTATIAVDKQINVYDNAEDDKKDSAILKTIDSLTFNWQNISRTNPENNFQKQYAGSIGNKQVVFNINLRAINIREQKDIVIWATIGDTLSEFYFNEDMLYGNAMHEADEAICPLCQSPKLIFEKKKYLTGYSNNELMAIRFSKDSLQIEGYLANRLTRDSITHFTINRCRPSLPLNYLVYRFHKHQKMKNSEVSEVSSTVELALDMPNKNTKYYSDFLKFQTGGSKTKDALPKKIAGYKKAFSTWKAKSHIAQSRSLVGEYSNDEIIYDQKNWLLIKTEDFTGATDYYGEMGYEYFCYDIKKRTLIDETDVMIENYEDSANHEKLKEMLDMENGLRGFAFVCPEGVVFHTSGNHGWEVGTVFVNWQKIRPFLKKDFVDTHKDWIYSRSPK